MKFTKMHGLGNSYVYVDGFEEVLEEDRLSTLARDVSDKNTGIGSDGLILIGPSDTADIKMRVFNTDGSEAKNCGNGIRCAVKLAYENGRVDSPHINVETLGGMMKAVLDEGDAGGKRTDVTVDMGEPHLKKQEVPMIIAGDPVSHTVEEPFEIKESAFYLTTLSIGNPHAVVFEKNVKQAPVSEIGPVLEHHSMFPDRANIEFVDMVSEREMNFRVWERGSGITQACGTGACAAVVAAVLTGRSRRGHEVLVHLEGGDLWITWDHDGRIWMKGPAETICSGEYVLST
ncbi:diaminopimelate epimerase [Salibacterium halotolerans]|uniref:Diaminopimelate epimerase n=1 Tax=Salibacterium halotolerans TaxID=1884432 RepID=A0A1I5QYJ8_9BACI|nr:diaminopimelate epimerase [Salibacterium halotolerans]SFP51339.1 diaminopimelate epimerase [Salibacterium halotolerans]